MREIKFRGLSGIGEWIYGSYATTNFPRNRVVIINSDGFGHVEVLTETVGQFTGLQDSKGVDIYEGDLLRWCVGRHYWEGVVSTIPKSKTNILYAIETFNNVSLDENEEIYTYRRNCSRAGARKELEFLCSDVEIIGNIHENPELLEK